MAKITSKDYKELEQNVEKYRLLKDENILRIYDKDLKKEKI